MELPVSNLLKGLGLVTFDDNAAIRGAVKSALEAKGLNAEIQSFRYGKVTLEALPADATFLKYEVDALSRLLEEQFPGEVKGIIVRVKKQRR